MKFLSLAARHLYRRETNVSSRVAGARIFTGKVAESNLKTHGALAARSFSSLENYEAYGKFVFSGQVADDYMKKHGSSGKVLNDPTWVKTHSDTVAKAVFDW